MLKFIIDRTFFAHSAKYSQSPNNTFISCAGFNFSSEFDLVRFKFNVIKFSGNLTFASVKLDTYMPNAGVI